MRSTARRVTAVLLTVLPLSVLLGVAPAHAQSAESLLVQDVPAGFVEQPAGEANRTLDEQAARDFLSGTGEDIGNELEEDGFKEGYLRTWSNAAAREAITSTVFIFRKQVDADAFLEGARSGAKDSDTFDIPGVPNSVGLKTPEAVVGAYAKKNQVFFTAFAGAKEIDTKRLVDIVQKHNRGPLAALDEAAKESTAYKIGNAVAGVAMFIGLVLLVRYVLSKRKQRNAAPPAPAWDPQAAFGATEGGFAPPPGDGYAPPPPPAYPPPTTDDDPYAPPPA